MNTTRYALKYVKTKQKTKQKKTQKKKTPKNKKKKKKKKQQHDDTRRVNQLPVSSNCLGCLYKYSRGFITCTMADINDL